MFFYRQVSAPSPLPTGYTYRYDSSDIATITTANGAVSSWASTGTITSSIVQPGSFKRPTHSSSPAGVTFTLDPDIARNDFMEIANRDFRGSNTEWYVATVVTVNSTLSQTAGTGVNFAGEGAYTNGGIWQTSSGWAGLLLYTSGSISYADANNYPNSASTPIPLATKILLRARLKSGKVGIALNNNSYTEKNTSASGGFPAAKMFVGSSAYRYFDGIIHDFVVYPSVPANESALVSALSTKWGI
jgi:hypothetical protein